MRRRLHLEINCDLRTRRRPFPDGVNRAPGHPDWMKTHEWMRRNAQSRSHVTGRNVAQTNTHGSGLHSGKLSLPSFFCRRPEHSDLRQVLATLWRFARRRRDAVQPVVNLWVAICSPAEHLRLQLRQLDLLIGYRIVGHGAGLLDHDLIVLPAQVAPYQRSSGGKIIQRPVAAAFEFGWAFA